MDRKNEPIYRSTSHCLAKAYKIGWQIAGVGCVVESCNLLFSACSFECDGISYSSLFVAVIHFETLVNDYLSDTLASLGDSLG